MIAGTPAGTPRWLGYASAFAIRHVHQHLHIPFSSNVRCGACSSASNPCWFLPARIAPSLLRAALVVHTLPASRAHACVRSLCVQNALFSLCSLMCRLVCFVLLSAPSARRWPCRASASAGQPFLHAQVFRPEVIDAAWCHDGCARVAVCVFDAALAVVWAVNRVVSVFVAPLALRYAIRRMWLSLLSRSLFPFALWGLPRAIRD